MVGLIAGRFSKVQADTSVSIDKFKKIEKDHGFDLGSTGLGKDEELDKAFKTIEDSILKLKEGELEPEKECRKMEVKNRMGYLFGLLNQ